MMDIKVLMQEASKARQRAYAPYSHFPVGAAVLADDGKIYCGCNVENVSYGLTMCAERNAIAAAIAAGAKNLQAIAVTSGRETSVMPCGACRQVMAEFGIKKVIVGTTEVWHELAAKDLLPGMFTKDQMK